ncbi:ECSIT domain protein [Ceratobasidium sp. AG-Ba]|nr:ECSIT domain protein [Ceratobasidium sp. AG-Ba]
MVGKGTEPSLLRPNLAGSSSSTSDENWARILEDVDPPSPHLLHSTRMLRFGVITRPAHRKYTATEFELRAMENIFERVFDMDASAHPQAFPLSTGRASFLPSSPTRRPGEDHELEFDKKREAMFACKSDRELLEWAMREVFVHPVASEAQSISGRPNDTSETAQPEPRPLHPEIYGRIVASLMKEFREQYNNPHLAMAIFDYTRRLSIISYVTGCTASSYSELMRTHWTSFRNLQAVVKVAEEMRINGVLPDHTAAPLLIQIHDELEPTAKSREAASGETMQLLGRLDELLRPPKYEPLGSPNRHHREKGDRHKGQGDFGHFWTDALNEPSPF